MLYESEFSFLYLFCDNSVVRANFLAPKWFPCLSMNKSLFIRLFLICLCMFYIYAALGCDILVISEHPLVASLLAACKSRALYS